MIVVQAVTAFTMFVLFVVFLAYVFVAVFVVVTGRPVRVEVGVPRWRGSLGRGKVR